MTAAEVEVWDRPDVRIRVRSLQRYERPKGAQITVTFYNNYGLSIIDYAGQGVEVMVLDLEREAVEREAVPDQALPWIWQCLQDDSVIKQLAPDELTEVIVNVSSWPARPAP